MKKVAVVGGGPAGIMAAIAASKTAEVLLFEQNNILGRKLLITGKGRCNVTNFCSEEELISQVIHNPKFLYSAFSAFNAYDAYASFEEWGVPLKIERGNRVFPASDRSSDIRDALKRKAQEMNVHFIFEKVLEIQHGKIICANKEYAVDAIILATGGCSYPLTGSTGDGYRMAKKLGHTIIKPEPALVSLVESGNICSDLMGLSLKNVRLSIYNADSKLLYSEFGEMLFTHKGISGPIVLSASSNLNQSDFPCMASIDLKPALDEEKLDKRLLRDFEENINKDFLNALDKILPKKIIPIIIERSGIRPHSKVHQITKNERLNLVRAIKNFKIHIKEKADFSEAIITSGGVDVSQIDPRTMESKLVPNLYFAGEVIDVDALTGGYNLQIAYSTGYLAGISASKE